MTTLSKLLATTAVAALVAVTPMGVSLNDSYEQSWISFDFGAAFAASGKGSEGDGSDDDDDDDNDEDNSGSGSGGDEDDDGEGNSGRSEPRVPGGSGCDDPGDIEEHPECSPEAAAQAGNSNPSGAGGESAPKMIVKIEVSATGIEIKYSDGSKEEIENGIYERKNSNNRTVERRRATGADIARLRALADRITVANVPSKSPNDKGVKKAEVAGENIEVTYNNGWKEEIEFGRYELKDRFNRTVVERPATAADRKRLLEIANG